MTNKNIVEKFSMNRMHYFMAFIFLLLFLLGCAKPEDYAIDNLSTSYPVKRVIEIANSNPEVKGYLVYSTGNFSQERKYDIFAKRVDDNERKSMPSLYEGLPENVYVVHYQSEEFELIVITDEKQVLSIVPLTKVII